MTVMYAVDARATTAHFPGIGRYIRSLLPAIASQLLPDERLIYFCSPRQRERLGLGDEQGLLWRPAHSSPFGWGQQIELPRLLRRYGVAVYHSPYYLMPYWPGTRSVLTVYDTIPRRFPHRVSLRARLLFGLTTRMALRTSDAVIAISQATKEDYSTYFDVSPEGIVTIPLAAASHFRPAPTERIVRLRRERSLNEPYVLYVGSNKPHKNLARLMQAWEIILGELAGRYELVLAGQLKAHGDDLVQQAAAPALRETVRLMHDVPDEDLVALFSGAELFVFPSLYEGFGLPVLEAMACGCAVVCSNRSSLSEIAEGAAVLFDPEAPSDIARAISQVLADTQKRKQLQKLATQRASTFSWKRTAAETLRVYRRVAP